VARVVVVSSSEIRPEALSEVVSADDELYIVVPAVEQSRLQWLANDEAGAREDAVAVGESVATAARAEPSSIEVKPDPPKQVVLDAIAEHQPDRIVVALRDGEEATWLEQGELDELPSEIDGIPVTSIRI
jgi:nucleotide-binding universal stress UspA family protein